MSAKVTTDVIVYRARNLVNGHSYIGVTRRGLARREHEHRYAARKGGDGRLHKALRKWGDQIQFEAIFDFEGDYELAMLYEAELVEKEQPEYNLVPGGMNRVGPLSDETLSRMRASHVGKPSPRKGQKMPEGWAAHRIGVKHSPETRAKMSAAQAGKPRPSRVGLKHSPEARAKMSAATRGRVGYWHGKKRPEAAQWLSQANKGKKPWNAGVPMREEAKAKLSLALKGRTASPETPLMRQTRADNMRKASKARRKKVLCLTDGKVYDSLTEAAQFYGLHKASIAQVARGKRTSVFGLRFTYEVSP
jgi:group I intron endonuclease